VPTIGQVRVLASLGLVGIQQSVPGPWPLSVTVCALAALAGAWAVATLRR
jgi:hypothetical protein